ncbi:hypothetical protein B0T17DRAFT_22129 [Bombardia bombarda]|uniref:Uncharacterized protein n=1 Tax=Bombardia bombarda TaxID=252184 RepID=A0AA40CE47_9PEZI|nr:hypothetical protein B0T17DRAFT_22129 [Bombardia bombarda]
MHACMHVRLLLACLLAACHGSLLTRAPVCLGEEEKKKSKLTHSLSQGMNVNGSFSLTPKNLRLSTNKPGPRHLLHSILELVIQKQFAILLAILEINHQQSTMLAPALQPNKRAHLAITNPPWPGWPWKGTLLFVCLSNLR